MMLKFTRRIIGSRDYHVASEHSDSTVRLLVSSGADYRSLKRDAEGLSFTLPLHDGISFEELCRERCIPIELVRERGMSTLIKRYRRRLGIPIGAALFVAVLIMSEQFVWEMRVVGNENVTSQEIISALDELGFGVGTFIPSIDFDLLHNEYLLRDDKLAWIAVNVRGTVATVEVRELERPEKKDADDTPYNLVASEDGIIEYVEILRGKPMVSEGMLVRAGELLASGIEDMKHGFKLVHAQGSVIAEVRRSITVEIPLENSVRTPTGREFCEKYLNFFGIGVKFFGNTENLGQEYDKIEKETPLRIFGSRALPLSVCETVYREYEYVPIRYTEDEARAEAFKVLHERYEQTLEGCELVSREMTSSLDSGIYRITCNLTVHVDIAREAPIYQDK